LPKNVRFPFEALIRGKEEHLRELLRNGAAALDDPTAPEILVSGAGDSCRVYAVV
jgi:hypothetical protein